MAHKWLILVKLFKWFRRIQWVKRVLEWLVPVLDAPDNLDWSYNLNKHNILITWNKSKCSTVTSQSLTVQINGEIRHKALELDSHAESHTIQVEPHDVVCVTLVAFIGKIPSEESKMTFIIPDLSKPIPPSDLKWEVLEAIELPEDCGVDN